MTEKPDRLASYKKTLLDYYEEEIMGEAYFNSLAGQYEGVGEGEKMRLLAMVERRAAAVMKPLLQKYGLEPRDDETLHGLGEMDAWATSEKYSWLQFMTYMVERYPGYVDDFVALEQAAPEADVPALKILTEHEIVAIEFAQKEIAGKADSTQPLCNYLGLGK
ncbi:MAG: hypothetical protein ACR2OR_09480 [Hyphomicrobiales bacterium]